MKVWFVDTSALLKRYVREPGSEWVRGELSQVNVLLAPVTPVEVVAALGRRFRQGVISQFGFYQARQAFSLHLDSGQYQLINWQKLITDKAMNLTFKYGMRAYDAVQLASALVVSAGIDRNRFTFLTADRALESVAQAEGLFTDNPLQH